MPFLPCHRLAECNTIDRTAISGWLYEVEEPAPVIIMSHGFNCVKEMTLPEVAEAFQAARYNVLLYDARSVEGQWRTTAEPPQPTTNGRRFIRFLPADIYTLVTGLQTVNAQRIILWGMSFGGVISACSAAIDRRPKAVVMVCPLFSYVQPHKAYAQLIKDRVSQLRGNEPYSLAPFNSKGDNLIGMGGAGSPGGLEAYNLMKLASERGAADFRDRIALQTYQKLAMFRPKEYLDMIRVPVMIVIPELDDISSPEEQREGFARIRSPKKEYWAKGKGHLNIVTGDGSKELMAAMVEFFKTSLEGVKIE